MSFHCWNINFALVLDNKDRRVLLRSGSIFVMLELDHHTFRLYKQSTDIFIHLCVIKPGESKRYGYLPPHAKHSLLIMAISLYYT